jgi:hypothetical protein
MSNSSPLAVSFKHCSRFIFYLLLFFSTSSVLAQDIKINGGFLSDSLKIGEQTAFYLSARYRSELNVLFPDSTFKFAPFEYERRNYFNTQTKDSISVDSAVYYLTTFEVDRVQRLKLPVFVVQARDCTMHESLLDSVLITQLVAEVPDSLSVEKLPLKMNTTYERVFFQFNFWVVLIIVGALLIITIVVWLVFGKRIRKHFKARSLRRNHEQFLSSYNRILTQLQSSFTQPGAETALSTWKKYMEQLESKPFTKLTTKETMALIPDEKLKSNLHSIDTAIYGHNRGALPSLDYLKSFAGERFSQKLAEVKHGKRK